MADMMRAFMDNLPVGYRFHPTDDEILSHYLMRKNLGLDEPVCVIPEVDLYRWEPEELRGKFTESSFVRSKDLELWFFCEQKPGRTQHRSTKGGYWKKTGQPRDMRSRYGTKQVIGSKNILTFFHGNSSSSTKTDWVMHEFHLPSNAFDGAPHVTRKNYIVCMIRCNSDEMANSPPSYECEQDEPMTVDIADFLEQEADDGLISEDLVRATMRSLEPLCRTPDDRGNLNFQPVCSEFFEHSNSSPESSHPQLSSGRDSTELPLYWTPNDSGNLNFQPVCSQFIEHSNSSPESSRTQLSIRRDSIELDSSYSGIGYIDTLADIFHQDNVYETPRHDQQNVVIMENKQTKKVESLHACLPIHEKKGIVEDDSAEPAASSLRMDAVPVKCKKESPKVVLPASSEAVAVKQAPLKIKEEMVSASSSSASIQRPRAPVMATPVQRRTAAATTKKKEINTMTALSGHQNPARELKPVTTMNEHISHSSICINTYVGVILLIIIFCAICAIFYLTRRYFAHCTLRCHS